MTAHSFQRWRSFLFVMSMGGRFLKFTPDAFGEGRECHMNLVELFTLLAFIVSLLALLVEVVHVTFDIVWRLSHDDGRNDKKKK